MWFFLFCPKGKEKERTHVCSDFLRFNAKYISDLHIDSFLTGQFNFEYDEVFVDSKTCIYASQTWPKTQMID